MSDGTSNKYGLTICTDSFSLKEVILLSAGQRMNILKIRFDLDTRVHYYANKPRIYFPAASMGKLKTLIEPYIIPFSKYKLEKGLRFKAKG